MSHHQGGKVPPPGPGTTPHTNWAPAPAGYAHPSQIDVSGAGGAISTNTNVGRATGKAGAYGGSELGSRLGGVVGPPIIGNVVGSLVGERVGEKAIRETGIEKKVTETGDQLAGVIGRRNVNKLGDMAMTAFGYSDQEVCICCPCLPASQILLFIAVPFYVFNWFKLGLGLDYDLSCSTDPHPDANYTYNRTDNISDIYPCEFGFHYLVASSAVWLVFLPFWIAALFGNCWRQCCCCCCDPIVLCGTLIDFVKRCCCECGRFNCCEFVWYSHCVFHVIWAVFGIFWLFELPLMGGGAEGLMVVRGWEVPAEVWDTVLASVVMDLILAGSELLHRARLHQARKTAPQDTAANPEQGVPLQPVMQQPK